MKPIPRRTLFVLLLRSFGLPRWLLSTRAERESTRNRSDGAKRGWAKRKQAIDNTVPLPFEKGL